MRKIKDLTGKRFGKLTVIGIGSGKSRKSWLCKCDCGTIKSIITNGLNSGGSKSCGCLTIEVASITHTTHGMNKTRTYRTWESMIQRCNNPKNSRYKDYGGRGIVICKNWLKFENFFIDMGERPSNKTLDRKNNDKGYNSDNCRWATLSEQKRNMRNNKYLTYKGETKLLLEWAQQLGMKRNCLETRICRGWTVERAFNTPILEKRFRSLSDI